MKTFNNNKKLKQELLKTLQHHQDLDAFIQGTWIDADSGKTESDTFKGCFYGCTMQTEEDPIEKFSEKYNIDLWYCYLTEKIFEGLPKGEYEKFPLESIEVLPIGVDINKIKSLFHYRVLEDQLQFCDSDEKVTNSILKCMELFKTPFDQIDESVAEAAAASARLAAASVRSAESAAWSAEWSAESAAWSATRAAREAAWSATRAAREAAEAAAWAAESVGSVRSAESAARSAEWSAEAASWSVVDSARSVARKEYYVFLKNTLIDCIKETY